MWKPAQNVSIAIVAVSLSVIDFTSAGVDNWPQHGVQEVSMYRNNEEEIKWSELTKKLNSN
jgi:hypothetical protein